MVTRPTKHNPLQPSSWAGRAWTRVTLARNVDDRPACDDVLEFAKNLASYKPGYTGCVKRITPLLLPGGTCRASIAMALL